MSLVPKIREINLPHRYYFQLSKYMNHIQFTENHFHVNFRFKSVDEEFLRSLHQIGSSFLDRKIQIGSSVF